MAMPFWLKLLPVSQTFENPPATAPGLEHGGGAWCLRCPTWCGARPIQGPGGPPPPTGSDHLPVQGDSLLHHGPNGGRWLPLSGRPGRPVAHHYGGQKQLASGPPLPTYGSWGGSDHPGKDKSPCHAHLTMCKASTTIDGNGGPTPGPCGTSRTATDHGAASPTSGCPLWSTSTTPDLDGRGPTTNPSPGRPRLRCPPEETVQALCPRRSGLDRQQIHHLRPARPRWTSHQDLQDLQEGDGGWLGKGRGGRDTKAANDKTTVGAHAFGLPHQPPHGHPLLPQYAKAEYHSPWPWGLVPVVLGQGHCGPKTSTQQTGPPLCREKCMEGDPQLGLRGNGPQGGYDPATSGHSVLDKGGLRVCRTAEGTQRYGGTRLPSTPSQVQGTATLMVTGSATME